MGTADPFGLVSDGTHGSFYYDDNYNMFYNPVYINEYKNWVAVEKSNGVATSASTNQAEGGFAMSVANVNIGLFMNRGGAVNVAPGGAISMSNTTITMAANQATGTATQTVTLNSARVGDAKPIDLIVGTDLGMAKVGLGLTYATSRSVAAQLPQSVATDANDSTDIRVRAGADVMNFQPFMDWKVKGKQKSTIAVKPPTTPTHTDETIVRSHSFRMGTRYTYGEWIPFAALSLDRINSDNDNRGWESVEIRMRTYGLGLARNTKLTEGASFNYALGYHNQQTTGGFNTIKSTRHIIPVTMSLEHDFSSWFTARAGMSYRLVDRAADVDTTASGGSRPTGRLGATIKAGKANIDWAFGGGNDTVTTAAMSGSSNVDSSSFDFSNGMFTTASLTYAW
jgi:hypothetical protein